METDGTNIRELYFSNEFVDFYDALPDRVKLKFEYVMDIVRTEYVLTTKFVKHLEKTDLYEMRISLGTNSIEPFSLQ
jgi:hypothetical protein